MSTLKNNRVHPIVLTKLEDTDHYNLWCDTTKSTFDLSNVLQIVLGTELRPTENDKAIANWDRRHKLAKEAILSALKPAQLIRVSRLDTAHAIWQRLNDEYGQISELKRAQLDAKLRSLRKADNKKMKDHVDEFESIRQRLEFHSGSVMSQSDVNVAFLISLGESEAWKNYRNSNLHRAITMRTVDLIAEVTIIDDSNVAASSSTPSSFHGTEARALATSLSSSYRGGHQRGGYRGSYRGGSNRGRGGNNNRSVRRPFDTEQYCEGCEKRGHVVEECPLKCNYCKERGHLIENCFKQKWANQQKFSKRSDGNDDNDKEDFGPYTPSFQRPQHM
jgi:gag-polypeptide of LTR copia-type